MFDLSRLVGPRLTFSALGIALLSGVALAGAAPRPAHAAAAGYEGACHFTSTPQYEGAERDYEPCMHMQDCQILANQAGHTIYANGCFGISPETVSPPSPAARSLRR
jgi:hypothetical protein